MNQKQRILDHIKDIGFITSWEAYQEYGITQLAARIFELKKEGHKFYCETITKQNRYGEPISYTSYKFYVEPEQELIITEAGQTQLFEVNNYETTSHY